MLLLLLFSGPAADGDCIPVDQASRHIGENQCITGTVVRVQAGNRGIHYLDFCDDYRTCSFTVVVFPHDLKGVGDIWRLQGKIVQIHGPVKEYDGRSEIILEQSRQLGGANAHLPALPKNFDVEKEGHYSAGSLSRPFSAKKPSKKRVPAKLPVDISDAESDPSD